MPTPPTPPTTRAAAALEKVHPQCLATAATAGTKWLGPLPSKSDLSPRLRQNRPSKGAITDQWPRSPFKINGRHRCPRSTKFTDQRFEGRHSREPSKYVDAKRREHSGATPHGPTDQGFET
jgi:hypothetical protein